MDSLNKTISFILGLVVVFVFLAVVSGRLNIKNKMPFLIGKGTVSSIIPTPTIIESTPSLLSKQTSIRENPEYKSYKTESTTKTPTTIPSAGSPTLLLPLFFSGLIGGIFLKKIK